MTTAPAPGFPGAFGLAGRTALVTGGGSGIGLAIARCLAAAGARVIIAGRRADILEEAQAGMDGEVHARTVDLSRPVVATCGSGTSACALVLSLHSIGYSRTAVYDGAWSEWGARGDTPVETGSPGTTE